MATGWAKEGAVQDQIDATINDAVRRVRDQLQDAGSHEHCEDCGKAIPEKRRRAVPGARRCVSCQQEVDGNRPAELFNRRGSKDSQLR